MPKAIKVENLSKAYQLGQFGTNTVSGDVHRWWMTKILGKEDPFLKIGERNDRSIKGESNMVWSLKDINFEVKQGEALGIIGQNGAGKSTLLKILSRVTSPTKGGFKIKGRVASLLEVGTGFHPELTGKENIFLNGAILGMRKHEIKKKLDEIIDFAGVERYIDTPVKRYSSGMYVRLAFAVAAHLDAEILVVDEVLAVGDAEFQKKCIGKMGDISKGEGRTILFVSHNLLSIKTLCKELLILKHGTLHYKGDSETGIKNYLNNDKNNSNSFKWKLKERNNLQSLEIVFAKLELFGNQPHLMLQVSVNLISNFEHPDSFLAFNISSVEGYSIMQSIPNQNGFISHSNEMHSIITLIELPPIIPGNYYLSVWVGSHFTETYDYKKEVLSFTVIESPNKNRIFPYSTNNGFISPISKIKVYEKNIRYDL
jgi:lipopolysaccharide transport system ATP-binding protein